MYDTYPKLIKERKNMSQPTLNIIITMLEKGYSIRDTADWANVSNQKVKQIMQENGQYLNTK